MITALSSKRIQDTQLRQRIEKANRLRRACTGSDIEKRIERYHGTRYALVFQVRVSTLFVVLRKTFFFQHTHCYEIVVKRSYRKPGGPLVANIRAPSMRTTNSSIIVCHRRINRIRYVAAAFRCGLFVIELKSPRYTYRTT